MPSVSEETACASPSTVSDESSDTATMSEETRPLALHDDNEVAAGQQEQPAYAEIQFNVNLVTVALSKCFRSSTTHPVKLTWALGAGLLVFSEVFALCSIVWSAAYPGCLKMEDCQLGQYCGIYDPSLSEYNKGTCEDCALGFLEDWWYGDFPHSAEADPKIKSSTIFDYCQDALDSLEEEGLFNVREYTREKCFYVFAYFARASQMDAYCLGIASFIVALSCGKERMQQLNNRHVRHAFFPVAADVGACRGVFTLNGVISIWFEVVEILENCVLLPLVPFSMIMLLTGQGVSAISCMLTGVGISFALEVDDLAVAVLLDAHEAARIAKEFSNFSLTVKEEGRTHTHIYLQEQRLKAVSRAAVSCVASWRLARNLKSVNCDNLVWRGGWLTLVYCICLPAVLDIGISMLTHVRMHQGVELRKACFTLLRATIYNIIGACAFFGCLIWTLNKRDGEVRPLEIFGWFVDQDWAM